jgi:hypothetical protein
MSRKRLGDLIGEAAGAKPLTSVPPADTPQPDPVAPVAPPAPPIELKQRDAFAPAELSAVPKYLRLIRKEARLREDQVYDVIRLARRLNRAKSGGERITENTLIRIGVDLLLARRAELSGATEDELRASVGLGPAEQLSSIPPVGGGVATTGQ